MGMLAIIAYQAGIVFLPYLLILALSLKLCGDLSGQLVRPRELRRWRLLESHTRSEYFCYLPTSQRSSSSEFWFGVSLGEYVNKTSFIHSVNPLL